MELLKEERLSKLYNSGSKAVTLTQLDRRLKNVILLFGILKFYVYFFLMWLVAQIVHGRQDRLLLLYPDDEGKTFSRNLVPF